MEIDTFSLLRDLIQQEQNLFASLTNNVFLLVALILGAQFFWNFIQSRREMKDIVKRNSDKFNLELKKYKDELKTDLENNIKSTKIELLNVSGDLSRSYANDCDAKKLFGLCFMWRLDSINAYIQADNSYFTRLSLDILVNYLKANESEIKKHLIAEKTFDKKESLKLINSIPDILEKERTILKSFVNDINNI